MVDFNHNIKKSRGQKNGKSDLFLEKFHFFLSNRKKSINHGIKPSVFREGARLQGRPVVGPGVLFGSPPRRGPSVKK